MITNTIARTATYLQNKSTIFWIALIALLSLLLYSDIFFGHQFLTFDDNWYIYENENVINLSWQSVVNIFTTTQGGQYSPIGEFYHSIIYHFFGKDAVAFKFFSLLTHIINSILVFLLMSHLTKNKWLALFVGLVFAIHPTQVETITWISAIYRIAVLFMLLGYLQYIKYLKNGLKKKYFLFTILFFILALFTKEQAILFPIGLVLINLYNGHGLFQKRLILENIVFGLLVLAFGLITLEITKSGGPDVVENQASLAQKFYLLSETFLGYLGNFLWPFHLSFSYPYPLDLETWTFGNKAVSVGIFVLMVALMGYACIKYEKLRFGILWAMGFLSLALSFSFLHLRDIFMADRYTYFAIIGFSFSLFFLLDGLYKKLGKYGYLSVLLGLVFLASMATATYFRVPVFKNSKTVWSNAVKVNPENPYAYNSLGFYYRTVENNLDRAELNYEKALKFNPTYFLSHSNLGKVYFEQGKYKEALKHINQTVKLKPSYKQGYENRVAVNTKLNKHKAIIKDLTYLIGEDQGNTKLLIARAKSYFALKDYKNSAKDAERAILLSPKNDFSHYLLGHSQYLLKQYTDAEENLSKAITLNGKKGSYYFFRSVSRLMQGKAKLALEDVQSAKALGHPVNEAYAKQVAIMAKK